MLAHVLALAVGLGSIGVYLAAFFFPEIHRKNDFIWSGVGLFYALVLWVSAGRITGSVLLGQMAGVALLGWSVTQTLSLRRQLTPPQQQTQLPSTEEVKSTVQEKVSNLSMNERFSQLQKRVSGSFAGVKGRVQQSQKKTPEAVTTQTTSITATGEATPQPAARNPVQIIDRRTSPEQPSDISTTEQLTTETATASVPEVLEPNELVQAARESVGEDPQAGKDFQPESQQGSASEPIRPHPPDPELVEAAIRDAEEKAQKASPPSDTKPTENP